MGDTVQDRIADKLDHQARTVRRAARVRRAIAGVAVGAVLAAGGALVFAGLTQDNPAQQTANSDGAPVTFPTIDETTFARVGATQSPTAQTWSPMRGLRVPGDEPLPRMLYVGAEYCPFCASERWSLVAALSRFGTFTGLTASSSAAEDAYPGTATVSFKDAAYSSKYLTFTGYETATNQPAQGGGYEPLETLSKQDQALFERVSPGSIPVVAFSSPRAGFGQVGSSYDPAILSGLTHEEILAQVGDPDTQVGREILSSANLLTAAICEVTDQKPASVCSAPELIKPTPLT